MLPNINFFQQIHTSLVNGRPGTDALKEFTEARYIRIRLQGIRTLKGELQGRSAYSDPTVTR